MTELDPISHLNNSRSFSGQRALIIHDCKDFRQNLQIHLEHNGFLVELHSDSTAALGDILRAQNSGDPFYALFVATNLPGLNGYDLVDLLRGACRSLPILVMLLRDEARPEQLVRCHSASLSLTLNMPVVEADLLDMLSHWETKPIPASCSSSILCPDSPASDRAPSQVSVLLVEDNLVNQEVAVAMLKKIGCVVTIANNGREAVDATAGKQFDLVFMDIQMPEMDGLEATRAIRARERTFGGHVPIVSLTAHALDRDRQQSFEAGVDDFLSKPVRRADLLTAVEKYSKPPSKSSSLPATTPPSASQMLALIDGDAELLGRLAVIFIDSVPTQLADLKAAISASNFPVIHQIAHKMKGSMGQVNALAAKAAALAIEQAAKAKDLSDAGPHLAKLEAEALALLIELKPLVPFG